MANFLTLLSLLPHSALLCFFFSSSPPFTSSSPSPRDWSEEVQCWPMGRQLPGSLCLVWRRLLEAQHSCSIVKQQDIITRAPPQSADTHTQTHTHQANLWILWQQKFSALGFLLSVIHALFKVFIYPSHIYALCVFDVLWSKNFDGKLFLKSCFWQ